LKLIECVLPWLVGSLSEEEARSFLQNMYMAGSVSIHNFAFLLVLIIPY
jgi:zinc finger-like protein